MSTPPEGFNPYSTPSAPVDDPAQAGIPDLPPVPFEDTEAHPGFMDRVLATFRLALSDPGELADRIPVTQSMLPAWTFHVCMALPFLPLSFLLQRQSRVLLSSFMHQPVQEQPLGLTLGGAVLGLACGIFIIGGMLHACLWMVGGTKHKLGTRQTVRLLGYVNGLMACLSWIPVLNFFVGFGALVLIGIMLPRVHRTDTWRGFVAILAMFGFCCCAVFVLAGAIIAAIGGLPR